MEKSFDFGKLLKNHEKKHKAKPEHLVSVAGGVQRRLQQNFKTRKSSRLTVFDTLRNLTSYDSPAKAKHDKKTEMEHRRLQLEKWKREKDERKKEAAAQKKKPFLVGAAPSKVLPPPPPPPHRKVMPSTSGRVTRSQALKQNVTKQTAVPNVTKQAQSFAPKNASFQAPQIKNLTVLPILNLPAKKKEKTVYKFELTINNTSKQRTIQNTSKQSSTQTTSKSLNNNLTASRITRQTAKDLNNKSKGKLKKPSPKRKTLSKTVQSSSSELESSKSFPSVTEDELTSSTESQTQKSLQSSSSSEGEKVSEETSPILKITPRRSFSKTTKTPKNPVPKSESNSEEKLRSPKSPVELPMTPEQIADEAKKVSPCVTMSRGKDNARREMKKKMQEGLLDEDTSDIDSVNHFRRQLASEIKRMTEMCEVWEKIQEQTPLSESIQELVLSAVGQARLLMTQKLAQFAALVERCARPDPAHALVTPADLAGFWDMVFMQIENIDMRFKNLEELQKRNWVEEAPVPAKTRVVTKNNVKKVPKPAANSRLRDMIAAARKAKQQQPSTPEKPAEETNESKTFEAGFFCVRSPVRSAAGSRATSANTTLLKAVLSSEANKSASKSSSFAMLRASILSKNMDHEGIALLPQTPINLNATPSRSILKSAASEKKSSKKSIKVVLFDDSDYDIKEKSHSSEEPFKGFEKLSDSDEGFEKLSDSVSLVSLVEKKSETDNKENSRRKSKLVRQDAMTEDSTGVMTRSRRKSMNAPINAEDEVLKEEKTPKRSARKKKALQEAITNV